MKDGRPDFSKFDCTIKTNLDSAFTDAGDVNKDKTREVIAILPVPNENNALEILVDRPLKDNSNASISFKDKRYTGSKIDTTNTVNFRLADAREPSVLSVASTGTKEIEVTFSEAVLATEHASGNAKTFAANNINNYLIDGRPLTDYGIEANSVEREEEIGALSSSEIKREEKKILEKKDESFSARDGKVVLRSYTVNKDKEGEDNRHKVKVIVGSGSVLSTGTHYLTVRNVGDWAAETDEARNSVSTQVLPFEVQENADEPTFTVNVQSPEQYELNFNTSFKVYDKADKFTTENTSVEGVESVLVLQERVNGTWTNISNGVSAGDSRRGTNPIRVSRVGDDDKRYLVEVTYDWSQVYDFENTRQDYHNKQFRLHVDAGKLVNVTNNRRNSEINIELNSSDSRVTNGNIMETPDLESPKVVEVSQATAKNGSLLNSWNVKFSEPVKISPEANQEGLTPSQKQSSGVNLNANDELRRNKGVPVAFARFVNVANPSQVVEGEVEEKFFIDAEDTIINVTPETKLSSGKWRLVVGSVSDDYGSTVATDGGEIEITAETVQTNFKVVWAAVATDADYERATIGNGYDRGGYVYIKFNKPVDLATALDENNYALNNQPLPQGANINANIKNYDNHDAVTDSVTIELPQSSSLLYGKYDVDMLRTQLSINGVKAADGEALSDEGMRQLPYNIGESSNAPSVVNDVKISTNYVDSEHDAVWGNARSESFDGFTKPADYYAALRDALNNDKYRKVKISYNAFTDLDNNTEASKAKKAACDSVFGTNLVLNINRAVDIDFDNADFNGNVVVNTTDAVNAMTISNAVLTGNIKKGTNATLTVDAAVVKDFVLNNVEVRNGNNKRAILLNNVWTDSFKLDGNSKVNGMIYVSDTDGFGFDAHAVDLTNSNIVINSNGIINLKGSLENTNIIVKQAATLNLGTLYEDGKVKSIADIDGARIRIEGPEAKVMITKATQADTKNTPPLITAAAKDVKIYLALDANQQLGSANCIKVDNGGNVIEIDENGRKVTTPINTSLDVTNINTTKTGIQDAFEGLKLVKTGAAVEITAAEFVSPGAFDADIEGVANGEITKSTFLSSIKAKVASILNNDDNVNRFEKEDGEEWKASDFDASCSLLSNSSILEDDGKVIKIKDASAAGPDVITISLTYDNVTYKRTIRVKK